MGIIRGKVRQLPVDMKGVLTLLNREWSPLLKSLAENFNVKFGNTVFLSSATSYNIQPNDQYVIMVADGGGAIVNLPGQDELDRRITIKNHPASVLSLDVQPTGGDLLEGAPVATTIGPGASIDVLPVGGGFGWVIVSGY